jgi:hypothetical protein
LTRDPINLDDQQLDDILCRWWQWKTPIQPSRDVEESPTFRYAQSSRQYDFGPTGEEVGYDDEEAARMAQVEHAVNSLDSLHRAAIYVEARALVLGRKVFLSPRLMEPGVDYQAVRLEARARLIGTLRVLGILC